MKTGGYNPALGGLDKSLSVCLRHQRALFLTLGVSALLRMAGVRAQPAGVTIKFVDRHQSNSNDERWTRRNVGQDRCEEKRSCVAGPTTRPHTSPTEGALSLLIRSIAHSLRQSVIPPHTGLRFVHLLPTRLDYGAFKPRNNSCTLINT